MFLCLMRIDCELIMKKFTNNWFRRAKISVLSILSVGHKKLIHIISDIIILICYNFFPKKLYQFFFTIT